MIRKFAEHCSFLFAFIANPKQVGSIIPSSSHLGALIKKSIKELPPSKVIEIGGGTGSITHFLKDLNPHVIELDRRLANGLRYKFPFLRITNGCAIDYLKHLNAPSGLVISIPLINNPQSIETINAIKMAYDNGLLTWVITYSYGRNSPLAAIDFKKTILLGRVRLNFPPAKVWLYE